MKILKRNRLLIIIAVAMITSLTLGAASCRKSAGEKPAAGAPEGPAIMVKATGVHKQMRLASYEAAGTVASVTRSVLSAKVMGRIESVFADEGDTVYKGQPLVIIDASDIQAQVGQAKAGLEQAKGAMLEVEQGIAGAQSGVEAANAGKSEIEHGIAVAEAGVSAAQANRDLAQKTYERYKNLKDKKSVSQQEFDQIDAQTKAADAALKQAQEQRDSLVAKRRQVDAAYSAAQSQKNGMEAKKQQVQASISQAQEAVRQTEITKGYATVSAPFDGVVVRRGAEPGQLAAPGAPLLTVEDNSNYRLEAQVGEDFAGQLHVGDLAVLSFDSLQGVEMTGTIMEIAPALDPASRTFTVKVSISDTSKGIRSGMYGKARFEGKTAREVTTVPVVAVVSRGQMTGVFTVENGRARWRLVKTGRRSRDGNIEILSGLEEGDVVITTETNRLVDGGKVVVQ